MPVSDFDILLISQKFEDPIEICLLTIIFSKQISLMEKINSAKKTIRTKLFVFSQLGPSPSSNPKPKPGFGPKLTLKLPSTPPTHPHKLFSQKGLS